MDLTQLCELQAQLSQKIVLPEDENEAYIPQKGDIILSLDIQYIGEKAFVAGDWQYLEGAHIFTKVAECSADFPYYPAFFCFREGPPLLQFLEKSYLAQLPKPHAIIIDGHGQAHPRRFGVASWLGVHTDLPCLGCAKDSLIWYEKEKLPQEKNAFLEIFLSQTQAHDTQVFYDKAVGYALRSQAGIKPIFVSNAHKISLKQSLHIIQKIIGEYRIPEPLRRADFACREASKGNNSVLWQWI